MVYRLMNKGKCWGKMSVFPFRFCRMLLLSVGCLIAAETAAAPAEKETKGKERAEKELDQAAQKNAANSGKIAVIKRLQALFSGETNPVITQTREFKPSPPYISVHEIPGTDRKSTRLNSSHD